MQQPLGFSKQTPPPCPTLSPPLFKSACTPASISSISSALELLAHLPAQESTPLSCAPPPLPSPSVHKQQITALSWWMTHCETWYGKLSSCLPRHWQLDIVGGETKTLQKNWHSCVKTTYVLCACGCFFVYSTLVRMLNFNAYMCTHTHTHTHCPGYTSIAGVFSVSLQVCHEMELDSLFRNMHILNSPWSFEILLLFISPAYIAPHSTWA